MDFHAVHGSPAGGGTERLPVVESDGRPTLGHAVAHGVGEFHGMEECLDFFIEGGSPDCE